MSSLWLAFSNIFIFIYQFFKSLVFCVLKPIEHYTEFGLHGVFASFGQGKTLTMCKIAQSKKKFLDKKNIDCVIYSNLYTNFSEHITSIDDIVLIAKEQEELVAEKKTRQVIILLDEIQTIFNSRSYQSLPIEIIAILCGNRHLNISIYYTVQASFAVDKYFRELSTDFIYSRKVNTYMFCYYLIRNRKGLEIMEEWCKVPFILFAHCYYVVNPYDKDNLFKSYDTMAAMSTMILENKGNECNKELFRKTSCKDVDSPKDVQRQAYKKLYK